MLKALCVSGLLSVGGISAAAQTVCFGSNCHDEDDGSFGGGQLHEFYNNLWRLDRYSAQTQWNQLFSAPFETRDECIATCEASYRSDLDGCRSVHRDPVENEDPITTSSRLNCYDAMRQREIQCISPYQLMNCPSG